MRHQIWIDRGGTFTDCLGVDPTTGGLRVVKVLSHDRAPLAGIRALLGLSAKAPIPPCDIRMGTTLATNALLERKGTPTGLAISHGFGDLLEIGDQRRPHLFALRISRPAPLSCAVVEIDARLDPGGAPLGDSADESPQQALAALLERGARSLAVVVIHGHVDGTLERGIGRLAADLGFEHVSLSHEVACEVGLVGRADTTVADAYLTPVIRRYVDELCEQLPGSSLRIMQSSGGLTDASRFRGRNSVLSGPAAGVVACAHIARGAGLPRVIGFDMGGTSTDVSRWDGDFDRVHETVVAGVRMRAPMLAVHTVAAGGGSICRFDGRRFSVGPDSAGADPGPLCYGHDAAAELTLTDVNLVLGRVAGDRFPFPLRREPVDDALTRICRRLADLGDPRTAEQVAEGFFRVAVEGTAAAIRQVSIEKGHDVRDHALVVFGGAGGQHACAIARRLGIRTLLFHPLAGVLSAFGMGVAPVTWHGEADVSGLELGGALTRRARAHLSRLETIGREALAGDGADPDSAELSASIELRYAGTEAGIAVGWSGGMDELRSRFESAHERQFGYRREGHAVEAVTVRVEVAGPTPTPVARPTVGASVPDDGRTTRLWIDGAAMEVPVRQRESLRAGERVAGPAIILEQTGTLVLEPGFELVCGVDGLLVANALDAAETSGPSARRAVDPVLLEIFNNLFMHIAEQMGTVLRRTALSTNIRDRLDYSCAVFDPAGGLVANAPHIPVHLGAMGESVRAISAAFDAPAPGDVFVTNDPSAGGTHLPDITVVTPVHGPGGAVDFFVASRGHHADVGGITPGSMPPGSRSIVEEGVVLPPTRIVRAGRFDEDALLELLRRGPHPARRPADNIADIQAQIAANRRGQQLLAELVERYGTDTVARYMAHVQDNAAACTAEAIEALPDGVHRFCDVLDDGTLIRVAIEVSGDRMVVDFAGTGAQVGGNLNAPRAVTLAAVLYVLRCLVGRDIPLNAGCLRPVTIRIPPRSVLDPDPDRAVAGGNVETSQRIVDVMLGALGKVAAGQGTMNNLTFGDGTFGYYETLGGGAGAGPGFDGASGVHVHMTNSRITDPEILESRFPVRLLRFALRRGSGGAGRFRGGDGLVRELMFLRPMRVSLLAERRVFSPFGLAGGGAGARGRFFVGERELPGRVTIDVPADERIRVETPGGGGWGDRLHLEE